MTGIGSAALGKQSILLAIDVAHVHDIADILFDVVVGTELRDGGSEVNQTALGSEVQEGGLSIAEDDVRSRAAAHPGHELVVGTGAGGGHEFNLNAQISDLFIDVGCHLAVFNGAARRSVAAVPQHDLQCGGFCHSGDAEHGHGKRRDKQYGQELFHRSCLLMYL